MSGNKNLKRGVQAGLRGGCIMKGGAGIPFGTMDISSLMIVDSSKKTKTKRTGTNIKI